MPMHAWREEDIFHVGFELPGISPDSMDRDVERNVVTVKAERGPLAESVENLAAELSRGVYSRQLALGENMDTANIEASYDGGVLTLRIPVAEQATPRKIAISASDSSQHEINVRTDHRQDCRRPRETAGGDADCAFSRGKRKEGVV